MSLSKLPNYLRTHRKRLGLSQADVSFLLGTKAVAQISRYECSVREPSLERALAYEVIFQKPVRELFGGLYERIEAEVAARAKTLASNTNQRPGQKTDRTQQIFTNIAARQMNNADPS